MIEIDDTQGEAALIVGGGAHMLRQAFAEKRAIGDTGERIVVRQIIDLLFLSLRLRLDGCNPRESNFSSDDGDTARLLEQLLLIVHTDTTRRRD